MCMYVHHFDGALFIRADRDAEIDEIFTIPVGCVVLALLL